MFLCGFTSGEHISLLLWSPVGGGEHLSVPPDLQSWCSAWGSGVCSLTITYLVSYHVCEISEPRRRNECEASVVFFAERISCYLWRMTEKWSFNNLKINQPKVLSSRTLGLTSLRTTCWCIRCFSCHFLLLHLVYGVVSDCVLDMLITVTLIWDKCVCVFKILQSCWPCWKQPNFGNIYRGYWLFPA